LTEIDKLLLRASTKAKPWSDGTKITDKLVSKKMKWAGLGLEQADLLSQPAMG